jgi:hypothetical protein
MLQHVGVPPREHGLDEVPELLCCRPTRNRAVPERFRLGLEEGKKEGQQITKQHGGHNKKYFDPWVEPFYCPNNTQPLNARGMHDGTQVVRRMQCGYGCLQRKSRHAVAQSIACSGRAALHCPNRERACSQWQQMGADTVVALSAEHGAELLYESHAVEGKGRSAAALPDLGIPVVLELVGEGHTPAGRRHHSTTMRKQAWTEWAKYCCALKDGWRVVRCHHFDAHEGEGPIEHALQARAPMGLRMSVPQLRMTHER